MKKEIITIIGVALVLLVQANAAIEISMSHEKATIHDSITLKATISNEASEKEFLLIRHFLDYPSLPQFPAITEIELEAGETYDIEVENFPITDTTESGTYTFIIETYKDGLLKESKKKSFEVFDTLKIFEATVRSCPSPLCDQTKTTFSTSEKIFLKVFNTEHANIIGFFENKNISFVNNFATVDPLPEGFYEFEILLKKEGYTPQTIIHEIAVSDESLSPSFEQYCLIDEICSPLESQQSCPQDCGKKLNYLLFLIPLFLIITITIFLLYKTHHKKYYQQ